MLKQKKGETGAKKINIILIFRLVNNCEGIECETGERCERDGLHALCMLCAKKTIFIEKNTTILQSMFVINKMTQ